MMKYLVNLLILGLVGFLGYSLYQSINEPIKFRAEYSKRKTVVTDKLQNIRSAQEIYRQIKGEFAPTFADLTNVLTNDSIPFRQLLADPNDPDNPDKFIVNVIKTPAIDSIKSMGIDLANLAYVPYSDKKSQFEVQADTLTYQSTVVPVVEVMTQWDKFMGQYADTKYSMYQKDYDPTKNIGFGSMSSPNLEGNWK